MIFKRLFKPKFQDPNPKIRIQAIASLEASDAAQKTQLHELAFNDEDANVNIAALTKLNSFALWNKTAETAKLDRVRKKAQSVIEAALFESSDLEVSDQEKHTFLMECHNHGILEKALQQAWMKNDQHHLVQHILNKLAKPNLTRQFFFNCTDIDLQRVLISQFDDEPTLQKVLKKCQDIEVLEYAEKTLANIALKKQRPPEIEKQSKLILSQLLALKDKSDYLQMQESKAKLSDTFAQIKTEFHYLSDAKMQEFNAKYQDIVGRLDGILDKLAPQWQAQQDQLVQKQVLGQLESSVSVILNDVSKSLAGDASNITIGQVEQYEERLEQVISELEQLSDPKKPLDIAIRPKLESLFNQLNQCKATLEHLPEFQQAIEQAKIFLSKFEELSLPSDLSQVDASQLYLKEQKQQWQAMKYPYMDTWPAQLDSQWSVINKLWRDQVNVLKTQLKQDLGRVRGKLRAVDSMITQGKFKAAMSLYDRVQVWYQNIPEHSRSMLDRVFEETSDKIANLKDWQDYIAEPRKPEELITSPLEIDKQAQSVKELRQQWNSLGKIDTESDTALNNAFDELIEKAFEPCRLHYAEQKTQRDANLGLKQQVIKQLQQLANAAVEGNDLLNTYRDLQAQWKQIGKVDYKQLDTLNELYLKAIEPVKQQLSEFFESNKELKQKLIKRAEKLVIEDPLSAVQSAKALQQEWKSIDSAGKKQDNQLWNTFRAVNDELFAKRNELQAETRKVTDEKLIEVDGLLKDMQTSLSSAQSKADIGHALEQAGQLELKIQELPGKAATKYQNQLTSLLEQQSNKLADCAKTEKQQQFDLLFEVLSEWTTQDVPERVSQLAGKWRQCFKSNLGTDDLDRQQLCIKLEILTDKPSPVKDSELRKTVQMQMMAEKLQQGVTENKQALLKQWIAAGPLTTKDLALLPRLQGIF
jgi:exonuclease SbcC